MEILLNNFYETDNGQKWKLIRNYVDRFMMRRLKDKHVEMFKADGEHFSNDYIITKHFTKEEYPEMYL